MKTKLHELLHNVFEVSTQAAGALLNLASDSSDYAKQIVTNGAVVDFFFGLFTVFWFKQLRRVAVLHFLNLNQNKIMILF